MTKRRTKEEVLKAARNMKSGGLRDVDAGTYEVTCPGTCDPTCAWCNARADEAAAYRGLE